MSGALLSLVRRLEDLRGRVEAGVHPHLEPLRGLYGEVYIAHIYEQGGAVYVDYFIDPSYSTAMRTMRIHADNT